MATRRHVGRDASSSKQFRPVRSDIKEATVACASVRKGSPDGRFRSRGCLSHPSSVLFDFSRVLLGERAHLVEMVADLLDRYVRALTLPQISGHESIRITACESVTFNG